VKKSVITIAASLVITGSLLIPKAGAQTADIKVVKLNDYANCGATAGEMKSWLLKNMPDLYKQLIPSEWMKPSSGQQKKVVKTPASGQKQADKQTGQNQGNKQTVQTPANNKQTNAPAGGNKNTAVQNPNGQTGGNSSGSTYSLKAYEQQVVNLTNQERAKHGLAPLQVDLALSKVAREKSLDMARNNYFSHNSPTYGSPFDMMKAFGIQYRTAGENIAKGQRTPEEVVNAWMNSEGHRANILNPNFTHIGVGFSENGNIWTQQFIGK